MSIIIEVVNTGRRSRIRGRIGGAGGHRGVRGARVGAASKPHGPVTPR